VNTQQHRLLEQAEHRSAHLDRELARLRRQSQELDSAVASSRTLLVRQQARIADLEADVGRLAGADIRARDLQAELQARLVVIAQLQSQSQSLAALQGQHAQLETDYREVQAQLSVKTEELATAGQALQESIATIRAAQRLSGTLEWRGTLERVLAAASERVRFERGTLLVLDDLQNELKVEAALNSPIAVSQMSRFKVGEGLAGRAVQERRALLVPNSEHDSRFKASDPAHQARSLIEVPLQACGEVLGVLSLVRPASQPFGDAELAAAESVAADAARALNNARLYVLLKEREARLEALVQRAWDLSASLEGKQVLTSILRGARQLVGGSAALLALMDLDTYRLNVVATEEIPLDMLAGPGTIWGEPVARDVVRTGKPWLAAMAEILPAERRAQPERLGMRYLVSIPVRSSAEILPPAKPEVIRAKKQPEEALLEVYGALNLYLPQTAPPSTEQLNALLAFGYQAARALKNVQRWERLQAELRAAQLVNARLLGRERFIAYLRVKIDELERELARWRDPVHTFGLGRRSGS